MTRTVDSPKGWLEGIDLEALDDDAYFLRCRAVGARVRRWDDCYIGLIMGAVDRELPRKKGFRDIYHMAGVQARMTRKRVTEVLTIARLVRCCPGLYRMFTRAEVAWTKVRAVARLARPERDAELCEMVRSLTRRDLLSWIREQSGPRPRPAYTARDGGAAGASSAIAGGSSPGRPEGADLTIPANAEPGSPGVRPGPATASPGTPGSTDGASAESGHPETAPTAPPIAAEEPRRPERPDARTLEALLIEVGVDPLVVDKLKIDQEVLSIRQKARLPLVDVLEEAIRAHRPAKRSAKLPYLHVITTCPACRCSVVRTTLGPLPVDEMDAHQLRQSGATVDLDEAGPEFATGSLAIGSIPTGSVSARDDGPRATDEGDTGPGAARERRSDLEGATSGASQPRRPPARVLRRVLARQGGRCAVRDCLEVLGTCHHLEPFAWYHRHDERQMYWLCRRHHDLAHGGGIANPAEPPDRWRPRRRGSAGAPVDEKREAVDKAVRWNRTSAQRRDEEMARGLAAEDPIETE